MKNNKFKQFINLTIPAISSMFTALYAVFKKLYIKLAKKLHFSITFKITTFYTLIFARSLMLLNILIFICFVFFTGKNIEDKLINYSKYISSILANNIEFPKNDLLQASKLGNMYISIFDKQKKIIYSTDKNSVSNILYTGQNKNGIYNINDNFILISKDIGKNKLYLVLNSTIYWNSNNIYLQITGDLTNELYSAEVLGSILFIIDLFTILVTIGHGSKTSRKMLSPIEIMTNTVKKINVSALDTRLNVNGSQDELKELAETFNNMLDRIQHSYEIQNQFVSDASHELRTPIAVIQGYINLLDRWGKNDKPVLEESIAAIKSEAEAMKDLVENLLFLARSDKKTQKIEKSTFELNKLISEIIKETELIDTVHKILNTKNENISIYADYNLLKEALRIFIDNSIKYTPIYGKITIDSYMQNNQAVITILDTGIGISKDDLPNIFNRFYRADKSRTKETGGTGLGLSIAKWIILTHKGTIQVDSRLNAGTKITLFLPL